MEAMCEENLLDDQTALFRCLRTNEATGENCVHGGITCLFVFFSLGNTTILHC